MPSDADLQRWLDAYGAEGATPEVLALAATLDDATGDAAMMFRCARADALALAQRPGEAAVLLASALAMDDAEHLASVAAFARYSLALLRCDTGAIAAAMALRPALLADAASPDLDASARVDAGLLAVRLGLHDVPATTLLDELGALAAVDAMADAARRELHALRALAHVRNGDPSAADASLAALDALSKEATVHALVEVARAAHRQGDNGDAIRWCKLLLARRPPAPWRDAARLCLGMAAWHSGRYDESDAAFAAILAAPDASDEDRATAHLDRFLLSTTRGLPIPRADVDALFAADADESPAPAILHHARGQYLMLQDGRLDDALRAFDTALTFLDPVADAAHVVETRCMRALVLAAQHRFDEATRGIAEAEAAMADAGETLRARFAQLRAYVYSIRHDAAPGALPGDPARIDVDFALAERGFAAAGRTEAVEAVRLERACIAAARGDADAALAYVAAAVEDPDARARAWLTCADAAHGGGAFDAAVALCDAVIAAEPAPARSTLDGARLLRVISRTVFDGRGALDEATRLLATGTLQGAYAVQLRVNRIGMLADLGEPVPPEERAFLFSDACAAEARWPDTVRAIRAVLLLGGASPEDAKDALADFEDDGVAWPLLGHRHLLLAQAHTRTGHLDAARESLRRGLDVIERVADSLRPPLLMMAGATQTALGDARGACESLGRSLAILDARGLRNETHRAARIHLAVARALDDEAGTAAAAADLEALLAEPEIAEDGGTRALALQMLGMVSESLPRLVEASEAFEAVGDRGGAALASELAMQLALEVPDLAAGCAQGDRALRITEALRSTLDDGPDRAALRRSAGHRAAMLVDLLVRSGDEEAAMRVPSRFHHPDGWANAPPVDLDALAASLPTDALAVEYLVGEEEVVAVVVHRDGRALLRTPWARDDGAAIAQLETCGALLSETCSAGDARALERALARLSERLVQPLRPYLAGRRRLIVGAGLELGVVPFAAMRIGADEPSLLDGGIDCARVLSLAPFANAGAAPWSPTSVLLLRGDDALAAGANLAFADHELTAIAARVEASGREVVVAPRRCGDVDLHAQRPGIFQHCDVIHYAGHVRRRPRDDGRGHDAFIFPGGVALGAATLATLALPRAPVVVLSGCESGDVRGGTSDLGGGLVRPFLAAGARAVVSSLWPASDERTFRDMDRLYAAWLAGTPLEGALGSAARARLAEDRAAGVPDAIALLHAATFHVVSRPH